MQTFQKTWDFLPMGFNAGNKRQCGPKEFVTSFGKTQEHYSSVGIQIFYFKNKTENTESSMKKHSIIHTMHWGKSKIRFPAAIDNMELLTH